MNSESEGGFDGQAGGLETVAWDPIPQVIRTVTITEKEAPPQYGHVTAPGQSQIYFDELMRIMDTKGVGFHELIENGIRPSICGQTSELLRDLKDGDEVTITTGIEELETQIRFNQSMTRSRKDVSSLTTLVNLRSGRMNLPVEIPHWVREGLRTEIDQPNSTPEGL